MTLAIRDSCNFDRPISNNKAALYGIFVGRWQHTCPKIGGNMSSIDKTGSVDYRSPRKRIK